MTSPTNFKGRRGISVLALQPVENGGHVRIIHTPADPEGTFTLVNRQGHVLAKCVSAKRLSDWAFNEGAQEVRSDYDLRLSDGEA